MARCNGNAFTGRGHDIALHPSLDFGIAIARRPGRYLQLFSSRNGQDLGLVRVSNHLKLTARLLGKQQAHCQRQSSSQLSNVFTQLQIS
ncbi:DUF1513 domain-containing protein [Reinekea marina]|uniref:DUF1513 domain-containing protein n=1 Tax=Reinekea marina TaxID=1310421 RepID=UPI0025B3046C|nr:DUF1513 domain-containing protein [Reinekea marina]MDN3647286.1 DUF1513 domain-containing protein [Reinekea marina]